MTDTEPTENGVTFTPTETLILEILAALYRLGDDQATFEKVHARQLNALAEKGMIYAMDGNVEGTRIASLTEEGRDQLRLGGYIPDLAYGAESDEMEGEGEMTVEPIEGPSLPPEYQLKENYMHAFSAGWDACLQTSRRG